MRKQADDKFGVFSVCEIFRFEEFWLGFFIILRVFLLEIFIIKQFI